MLTLVPISQIEIDWKTFLRVGHEVLGRSPTTTIDEKWLKFNKCVSDYLSVLKEIQQPGADPFGLAGSLLDHVHVGFLLITTKSATLSIVTTSRLRATPVQSKQEDYYLTVISGNLSEWRTALLDCCVDSVSTTVREFGTRAYEFFDQAGLRQFMLAGTKVSMADGTMRLVR